MIFLRFKLIMVSFYIKKKVFEKKQPFIGEWFLKIV